MAERSRRRTHRRPFAAQHVAERFVHRHTDNRIRLGRIAAAMQAVEREPTPLQRRLERLARWLASIALVLVGIIFMLGLARGEDARLTFLTAMSLAVAAVPEGLPAVVTVTLALGAQRLLRGHALVRKLLAVETLGSVTVICSDKTGTLTQNRMTATKVVVGAEWFDLSTAHSTPRPPELELALAAGTLCNDAFVQAIPGDEPETVGDPTEVALAVAAARMDLWKTVLEADYPRIAELPFDSVRKRMLTVHRAGARECSLNAWLNRSSYLAFAKGAPETLLDTCSTTLSPHGLQPLSGEARARILEANAALAAEGLRVLAVAFRPLSDPDPRVLMPISRS
jgi:P-type Ca2+ transporter type 2C